MPQLAPNMWILSIFCVMMLTITIIFFYNLMVVSVRLDKLDYFDSNILWLW